MSDTRCAADRGDGMIGSHVETVDGEDVVTTGSVDGLVDLSDRIRIAALEAGRA